LLICFAVTATAAPSWSAEKGIFFTYTTAQRLYTDLKYYREDSVVGKGLLSLAQADRRLLEQQVAAQDKKVVGLELDKTTYQQESDRFQALYVTADQARVKAENNAPSRLRWFAAGVLAALIAGIAGAMALK
jgi:hypothetical protein